MAKRVIDVTKNSFEVIRVPPNRFKGYDLVDIRVYYRKADSDEYLPSPKGLCFQRHVLPRVISALQEMDESEGEPE